MPTNGLRILLVEDDLHDIFFIKRAFQKARLDSPLQVVTDGEEAIRYLRGEEKFSDRRSYPLPNLIITDIKMPRRNGFEVLEWVKTEGGLLKRIPVVVVSSSERPADINRAYELGANAYMLKPVGFQVVEQLFESIVNYWGRQCAKPSLNSR